MAEGAKALIVTGAVAVVALKDGSDRYLYRGAIIDPDLYAEKSVEHVVGLGLVTEIELVVEIQPEVTEEPYKGVTVTDLKTEIETRNKDREDGKKIVPAEPGNRPEIVAALVADDTANKS